MNLTEVKIGKLGRFDRRVYDAMKFGCEHNSIALSTEIGANKVDVSSSLARLRKTGLTMSRRVEGSTPGNILYHSKLEICLKVPQKSNRRKHKAINKRSKHYKKRTISFSVQIDRVIRDLEELKKRAEKVDEAETAIKEIKARL